MDTLTTVRMLKEKGVEVYFEKENIYTLDSKGELLITIMSSLAQGESRSISDNVTWGMRKRFADGKVALPYKQFLRYRKGADGLPDIVPEEAKIVVEIYSMFLEGKAPSYIARHGVDAAREALIAKRARLLSYLAMLCEQGPIRTFNETLWCGTVAQVRIKENGTMRFIFRDGAVVEG